MPSQPLAGPMQVNSNTAANRPLTRSTAAAAAHATSAAAVQSMGADAADDAGFATVEDRGKAKKDAAAKRKEPNSSKVQAAKTKVIAQEDRAYIKSNFTGP